MKNTSDGGSNTPGGPGGVPGGGRSRSGSSAAHQRRISVSKRAGDALQQNGHGDGPFSSSSSSTMSALEVATTSADIRAALAGLHTREDALHTSLQKMVGGHADLSRDLLRLDSLRATLGAQVIATRGIATTMLAGAAETAGRLSSTVRSLDLEKERVEATLRVVEQVAELKACVAGVVGSMGAPQDWEAAAAYLARASRIPVAIIASGFANAVVPTIEVPDPPAETLEAARESLCGLFLREFERAAKDSDDARVTRFFKLFPLIGRTDVGLDVYGRYVCQGVAESARNVFRDAPPKKDGFFYANALAKLFTHISQIVESHGTLVERHYGGGQMIKVISRLQKEADVQGGMVVDAWSDERGIDRKLTDVKSYPFSFLVQSFLAMQRGPAGLNSSGGGSGIGTPGQDGTSRVNSPALGGGGGDGDVGSPRQSEDEGGVNMREVDGLLNEIAVMLGRWSLYSRFLAHKCRDEEAAQERAADEGGKDKNGDATATVTATATATATSMSTATAASDRPLALPAVLVQSNLQRKVAARLVTPYNLMSTFFFRRSVEKAFQLEEMPGELSLNMNVPLENNPPYILSAVDDVMYIVNAVIQKCMSTLQRDVVVGVIPPVARVLGSDFIGMIQRKMRDEAYPRPLAHGGFPPEDRIIAFIVLINSLDMAMEYLARIVSGRMGMPVEDESSSVSSNAKESRLRIPSATAPAVVAHLRETFSPFDHDVTQVAAALNSLFASFSVTAAELQNEGLTVLFNQVVKLRLRPILSETFRDADYTLDEQELADYAEANDEDLDSVLESVGRRFEHGWDALMRPLARIMTPRTFAHLADLTAHYLARVLEKRTWTYASSSSSAHSGRWVSAYGAIRMERDMNSIVGAIARGSSNYGARELFAKTTQILMVANMEDDEWEELGGGIDDGDDNDDDGMVWHLTEDERRRARGMVRRVV
ncbi:Golgi transport complex subunit 4 [Sporothrix curviconia]|uniref:Conserved oligomeric Golgi complex subunit 4 n=1 Tax=Sporothrix curviconia TaxID=1260050 RepID=A0ABP0BJG1_9PEZI